MKAKKILFIADGNAPTGFARVSQNIIRNLNFNKFDIYHLAINYRGDPHTNNWKCFPAQLGGDYLGINRIQEFTYVDGIFILNDP
jgi:hypothetical protein